MKKHYLSPSLTKAADILFLIFIVSFSSSFEAKSQCAAWDLTSGFCSNFYYDGNSTINPGCTSQTFSNNYDFNTNFTRCLKFQFTGVAGVTYNFQLQTFNATFGNCYIAITNYNCGGSGTIYNCWATGTTTNASWLCPANGTYYVYCSDNSDNNPFGTNGSEFVTLNYSTGGAPPAQPSSISPTGSVCAGASVQYCVTNVGGITYAWTVTGSGNSITSGQGTNCVNITWATSGTISVTASNGSCISTASSTSITVNPVPTANAGADKTICNGQSTALNGSGSGPYNWSPSTGLSNPNIASPTASPAAQTTYTLTATNGCGSATDFVTVFVNSLPVANAGVSQTICNGQSATLNGSGGGTYNWSPATGLSCTACQNPVASPSSPITYTVTVTNASNCTAASSVSVVVNSLPAASAGANATICSGQTATLIASGGGTYAWNTGATTAVINPNPTTTTLYTVTITNGNGCTASAIATVNVNPPPAASISSATTVCSGSSVTLTASGGGTYVWNTGATSASIIDSPTANTTYTVTVSNGSCSASATASVNISSLPSAFISGNTNICIGDATTLTASGGGTYVWNTSATTANINVSPTTTTPYTVTVTNSNGCSNTVTSTVNVAPSPTASVAGNTTICSGSSSALTASGGLTYSWNTGATTSAINVSPTTSATYTVIAFAGTCSDTTSISITVNPKPNANINSASTSICSGQNATLTATGGGTYSWSTGATLNVISVSPTANASYSVTVTNANGCTGTAVTAITIIQSVIAAVSGNATVCAGNKSLLTASGGTTYSWNTGATTASINAPSAGTYTVYVSNGSCKDTAFATVTVNPSPTANTGSDVTITYGNSTSLNASGGGTYSWSTGATTNTISVSPAVTTDYCVYVTNSFGCTDSSCVRVNIELNCGELFIPNAFSPNGDMKNDYFVPHDICFRSFNLVIYDRWGLKVFETQDINTKGWDGSYNGKDADAAVFYYIFNYELLTGETGIKKGNISLLK